ncbi:MAG: hypothetical protein AAF465_12800 [Pseudomonadota bacterium]
MNRLAHSAALLLCCSLVACATANNAPTASNEIAQVGDQLADQAQAAYTAEDWPTTARLYTQLTQSDPTNVRYWYRLAVAQRYIGQLTDALDSLQQGVNHGLPVSYADYERAKVAATQGQADNAIRLLRSAAAAGLSGQQRVLDNEQLAALVGTAGFDDVLDQLEANANPCRAGEFRHFDFWLGTWDVADANGTPMGRNTISSKENGCLILEEWQSASGGTGMSMNYYDVVSSEWTQVWVSPGLQLRITGGLIEGSMVLEGVAHTLQQGLTRPFRGTWTKLEDGRVRQFFEQQDAAGNWTPWFEGFYTKRATATEKNDG